MIKIANPKVVQRSGDVIIGKAVIYGTNESVSVFSKIAQLSLAGRFIKANRENPENSWRNSENQKDP